MELARLSLLHIGVAILMAGMMPACRSFPKARSQHPPISRQPSGWQERSIDIAGQPRWYRIYRPTGLAHKAPLVLLLHGGTQSMYKLFGPRSGGSNEWLELAKSEKFMLLVPNGTHAQTGDPKGNRQRWNDVRANPKTPDAQDLLFIDRLITHIQQTDTVDPQRIYVTGASNGGLMTYYLLMKQPQRFAAAAAFVANLPEHSDKMQVPAAPTPLMLMNGTEDPLMKWQGGTILAQPEKMRSAPATLQWWLKANRAHSQPQHSTYLPDHNPQDGCRILKTEHPALPQGAPVWFYTMEGGGHSMPSIKHAVPTQRFARRLLGPPCQDAEGAVLAWNFFKSHTQSAPSFSNP